MLRHSSALRAGLCCLLALLLCAPAFSVFAEAEADLPEIQLDLADTTGHVLIDRLWEIRYAPDTWEGIVLRIRGQYYAEETEEGVRRSLIVTDCLDHCSEIAFQLIPAEETDILWPEINSEIELVARVAVYETAYGSRSRLAVYAVSPLASVT